MKTPVTVTTFYVFFSQTAEQVQAFQTKAERRFAQTLRGLIITGTEGFNGTIAGPSEEIEELKVFLQDFVSSEKKSELQFKDSKAHFNPFRLFKIKVRKEIVTLGNTQIVPESIVDESHLEPEEWDRVLSEEDVTLVDTRNWYETEVGKFEGAIDPNISDFQQFPEYLKKANFSKDKKLLMYCTGGIRCEKAAIDARQQGFKEVYQLKGGILNYFAKQKQGKWEGECFVFDNRVAVNSELEPTKNYQLCPHCGQPGKEKIECRRCDTPAIVCEKCLSAAASMETCSKNCEYQYRLHPERKGKKQLQGFRAALQTGNSQ